MTEFKEHQNVGALTMHVLVVDDESVIANSLISLLQNHGFEARAFSSGQATLDYLQDNPCDVVITDLNMPGMNGYELTLAIKSNTPKLPVILYSGNAKTASISKWRNSRYFAAILTKPTPFSKLVECINLVARGFRIESRC